MWGFPRRTTGDASGRQKWDQETSQPVAEGGGRSCGGSGEGRDGATTLEPAAAGLGVGPVSLTPTLEAAVTLAEDHRSIQPGALWERVAARRREYAREYPLPSLSLMTRWRYRSHRGLHRSPGYLPETATFPTHRGRLNCQDRRAGGATGALCRECPLMKVGQTVRVTGRPAPSPGPGATYCVPLRIQGGTNQALVDSGCTQSMIH
ncbi:uncharacterized protein AB9W97_002988 [Spinachia spinachia]